MKSSKPANHKIFPINSQKKFAFLIQVPLPDLWRIAEKAASFYSPFIKEGRPIDNPQGDLKKIQSRIHRIILSKYKFPDFIIGGVKGKSLNDHLKPHVDKSVVITLDVKKCFPNLSYKKIYKVWIYLGAFPDTARLATLLTTFQGHLPQGAPTSNALANLSLLPCLIKGNEIAKENGYDFSQMVDDSAFSGTTLDKTMVPKIVSEFINAGFKLSHKKLKVQRSNRPQIVTKRLVNRKPNLTREMKRNIRAAVFELFALDVDSERYKKNLLAVRGRIIDAIKYNPSFGQKMFRQISKHQEIILKNITENRQ
ncbi:MAG TPA: reverse transcriptase family protein [Candidatus Omnitrophota bacterium]|nr:reverse transcriptase family protein [Candidatus Omnitrophota bacterium]